MYTTIIIRLIREQELNHVEFQYEPSATMTVALAMAHWLDIMRGEVREITLRRYSRCPPTSLPMPLAQAAAA